MPENISRYGFTVFPIRVKPKNTAKEPSMKLFLLPICPIRKAPTRENSAVDKVCTESIFPTKSSVYPLSFRKIPTYMLNTPAENESKKLAVK